MGNENRRRQNITPAESRGIGFYSDDRGLMITVDLSISDWMNGLSQDQQQQVLGSVDFKGDSGNKMRSNNCHPDTGHGKRSRNKQRRNGKSL